MDRFRREVTEDRFPLMVDHVRYHERHREHAEERVIGRAAQLSGLRVWLETRWKTHGR